MSLSLGFHTNQPYHQPDILKSCISSQTLALMQQVQMEKLLELVLNSQYFYSDYGVRTDHISR